MKRNKGTIIRLIVGTLSYIMIVTGCGGSDSASKSTDYSAESSYEAAEEAAGLYDQAYETDSEGATNGGAADEITEEKATNKRKLITNMSMRAESKEFDKTLDFIKNRTTELGGYIESFSTEKSSYNDERTANLTLRIPEEKLTGFVDEFSQNSNITSQEMNVTDVTLTYADLESHRNALRAEEQQLLSLMEKAETIEDIMTIQDKLTDVRYQLESMESQLRTYDNQITFSTLNVTLREVIEYTPEPVKNPTFAERAKEGFVENLEGVIAFFTELLLLLITHIPVLVILLVIVIVVIVFIRAYEKKRKKKLASMPRVQQPVMPKGPVTYGTYNGYQAPKNDVTNGAHNPAKPDTANSQSQQGTGLENKSNLNSTENTDK
ncbi:MULTISPECIES: DUF4349 domain-containing protein [unclassified Butyrivibrio]|uniref:DUF4349 domain-containing protein n=1 Tax=unclassified Butyrivibrio TaxID=2639466 RepID=UPI0004799CED|nr:MULTISPECIES: DUF4349 domain-containing protein [unclassified Butyrivibrio]